MVLKLFSVSADCLVLQHCWDRELGGMSEMGMNEDSVIWVTVQTQTIAGKWQ